jgi:hypothetical protein
MGQPVVLVGGHRVTGRGPVRLAVGVLVAVLAIAVGVVGNAAAGQQHWPGVLDLARAHPWPAFGTLVLIGVLVEVVLWSWRRGESGPTPPPGTGTGTGAWNVPPRSAVFTGRDRLLEELRQRLGQGGPVVVQALHGRGGVGKTTLAVEYAYRFAQEYQVVWWVDAERPELIGEQLAALGAEAGWVARDAPTPDAVAVVRRRLHTIDRWLVVFDHAIGPAQVCDWLPQRPGHVIVTSRYPHWEQLAAPLPVEAFTRTESVTLLHRLAPSLNPGTAERISAALGDLPLAITQAGGVLAETGIGGQAYLAELRRHAAHAREHGHAAGYPGSLAAAIQVCLDKVIADDPAAVQLLQIGALLAPEPVPLDLLFPGAPDVLPDPLAAAAASGLALAACVARLGRYGLVTLGPDGPVLHRLTQAVTADQLDPDARTRTRSLAERLLTTAQPATADDPARWPGWARLLPHLLALDPATTRNPRLRDMAEQATWYLLARGDLTAGYTLARRLYQAWRQRLGDDHPDTLNAADNLAAYLRRLGRADEAETLEAYVRQRRRPR